VFEAQEVREEGASQERVAMLIQDEILSLSMMRYAGQPLPVEGSEPIKVEALAFGGIGRITTDDLKGSGAPGAEPAPPRPQGTALVEMLEGRETIPMAALPQPARRWRSWLLWGAVAVVVLGGAGAAWFLWLAELVG